MNRFIAELQRRRVIRLAGIYIVVGWVIAQAANMFEESLDLPAWFDAVAVSLLLLGFPVALLLAWAFDMTPEGPERTHDVAGPTTRSHLPDYLAIAGIVAVCSLLAWQQWQSDDATTPPVAASESSVAPVAVDASIPTDETQIAPNPASIAVLPFVDLSQDGDQQYFTDGLSEELLNVLVRIDGLRVASRTSSFQFKGREIGLPAIAEALKVRHILEGSVRKSGDNIRVTAQLIDASNDEHLWSQTYDKTLSAENLFLIQDEISAAIVAALNSRLPVGRIVAGAASDVVAVETDSLDAYDNYLQAREIFRKRSSDNLPTAIQLLESALEIDPEFARAWAGLAATYSVSRSWGINDRDYDALAVTAADKATELDPALPLPYSVRANAALQMQQWAQSMRENEMALTLGGNLAETHYFMGQLWQSLAFHEKAIASFERCLEIDPGYQICRRNIALDLMALGRLEEAASLYEQTLLEGQSSWTRLFAPMYAALDDRAALLQLLTRLYATENQSIAWLIKPYFRSLTEEDYSRKQLLSDLRIAYDAEPREYDFDLIISEVLPAATGRTDVLEKNLRFASGAVFNYYSPAFWQSPERKQVIVALGLPEYWREHGFPPRCRPVGNDDFHCD